MTHIARARRERNAQLIVVDPYRTPTAKVADTHLMLKPGTDGALACAIMHVLFRDGHADRDYMRTHADVPAELEAHLASRTPQWAAAITGLPVAQIEDVAKLYGTTQRAFIRVGFGFSRSRNGAANVHAVSCLATVGGKWQHRGRRHVLQQRRHLQNQRYADQGHRSRSTNRSACSTSRAPGRYSPGARPISATARRSPRCWCRT